MNGHESTQDFAPTREEQDRERRAAEAEQLRERQWREEDRMGFIVKSTGATYAPAPAGMHVAVCCDVVDEGMHETTNDKGKIVLKPKVSLWFQIDEIDPATGEFFVVRRWYTASLNDQSSLYADLVSWRGRAFTDEELEGFDLEKLLGVPCLINVVHKQSTDGKKTYANIASINPPVKGTKPFQGGGYVRRKDRPESDAPNSTQHNAATADMDETLDSVPF